MIVSRIPLKMFASLYFINQGPLWEEIFNFEAKVIASASLHLEAYCSSSNFQHVLKNS